MAIEYFHIQLRHDVHAALPVEGTAEVLESSIENMCSVPGVDPVLMGVANWRGSLLWNIDLSDLLGVKEEFGQSIKPLSNRTAIVITDGKSKRQLGCWIEQLVGMIRLTNQQIYPVPEQFPTSVFPYSAGWVKLDFPLLILDPRKILDSPRWQQGG